jgi:CBS domain-containing protein
MNVREMMTRAVQICGPNDSLNTAARLMWENDCGAIPVVDAEGKTMAMITDRDISMAAYTQGLPLASMSVSSAATRAIITVREDESLDAAGALMRKHQIRRIPVVDAHGKPVGIVSMNDLAHRAHTGHHRHDGLNADTIVRTLAAVCAPSREAAASQAHAAE